MLGTHLRFPMAIIFLFSLFWSLRVAGQGNPNPVPVINNPLVPTSTAPGGPAFTLTVNGTGFVPGAVVNWNGSPRTITFISNSQLTVSIKASDIASAGTATVTVSNPGSIASQPAFFSVTNPVPAVGFALAPLDLGQCANVVGDFNRDGKLDLVDCKTNSILLGNGDGTFTASPPIIDPQVLPFVPVATADLNNDGKPDLVSIGYIGLVTRLGNGDGTFQAPIPGYTEEYFGGSVAVVGDFNRDGRIDIAVASMWCAVQCSSPGVRIYLGNGDGTFQTPITYESQLGSPTALVAGDFNRDGKLDLVVSDIGTGLVFIQLGNGDGTFQVPQTVGSVSTVDQSFMASGDLNGDGNLDLVVTDGVSVTVLLGKGDGTFAIGANPTSPRGPSPVTLADFNGDGKLDLAILSTTCGSCPNTVGVSILLGNGDGTFQPPTNFNSGLTWPQLAVGDVDGNGQLDLAFSNGVSLVRSCANAVNELTSA